MLTVTCHGLADNDYRREAIEQTYAKALLDLCNSEQHAIKLRDQHNDMGKPPISPWLAFNQIARIQATVCLLPSERPKASFIVTFS